MPGCTSGMISRPLGALFDAASKLRSHASSSAIGGLIVSSSAIQTFRESVVLAFGLAAFTVAYLALFQPLGIKLFGSLPMSTLRVIVEGSLLSARTPRLSVEVLVTTLVGASIRRIVADAGLQGGGASIDVLLLGMALALLEDEGAVRRSRSQVLR